MTSRSVLRSASQEPRLRVRAKASGTLGDLAGDFAAAYGLAPDDWQRLVLEDWLSESRGKWAHLTCGLAVPRQNGKNALLEIRELFGAVGRGEKILHTAHEVKTAQKHFRRLKHFFGQKADDPGAKYPELNALVQQVRNVNGQEAIFLTNGGSIEVVARSKNSGRGFTVDVLVLDEAQELGDDALEALMPTTSAAPLGNPQWIYTGTPPGPFADGEVFTRTRADALSEKPYRIAWAEWSVDTNADLDNRDSWFLTNPGLASGRLQLEVIEGERGRYSPDGFARERLGWWKTDGMGEGPFPDGAWTKGRVSDSAIAPTSPRVFGLDVSWDRSTSYIVGAGLREDGSAHVEMAQQASGTHWVVPWLTDPKRAARHGGKVTVVAQGRGGPVASLLDELRASDLVNLIEWQGSDLGAASGAFYDAVVGERLFHPPWPALDLAAATARTKPLGDGWGWDRRRSPNDASPLVAATGAVWHVLRPRDAPFRSAYEESSFVMV